MGIILTPDPPFSRALKFLYRPNDKIRRTTTTHSIIRGILFKMLTVLNAHIFWVYAFKGEKYVGTSHSFRYPHKGVRCMSLG